VRKRLPTWGFVQAGLDNQQCSACTKPCSLKAMLNESTITTVCKVIGGLPDDGLTGEQSLADIYKNYHEWTII